MGRPAEIIRRYLERHGGRSEALVDHLLVSFEVAPNDAAGRERIVQELASTGVAIDGPLEGQAPEEPIELYLQEPIESPGASAVADPADVRRESETAILRGVPPGPQPAEVSGVFSGINVLEGTHVGVRIGRASDNDIVVDDLLVSRHHAELHERAEGGYELRDLGSANGTFLNGRRVERAALEERDVVTVGHHVFHVVGAQLDEYVDEGAVSFQAAGLTVHTPAGRTLLNDVSFGLEQRAFLAVVGPSGAGKSTLLNALSGFRPAGVGAVTYDGRDLYANYEELRLRIGFVPQEDVLHSTLTVRQALGYAAELRFPADAEASERLRRVEEVLGELGLTEAGDRRIDLLSGGQRRRVAVGVELARQALSPVPR